jgi:hypothetical protein
VSLLAEPFELRRVSEECFVLIKTTGHRLTDVELYIPLEVVARSSRRGRPIRSSAFIPDEPRKSKAEEQERGTKKGEIAGRNHRCC